jgi:hypothetical protein
METIAYQADLATLLDRPIDSSCKDFARPKGARRAHVCCSFSGRLHSEKASADQAGTANV